MGGIWLPARNFSQRRYFKGEKITGCEFKIRAKLEENQGLQREKYDMKLRNIALSFHKRDI